MIPSHYALSLHGVISVLQLHTTSSKNHYNIFKFDSQKWYLLERSKSTYCTSGLNSRPRVMYYPFHMLKQGLLKIWTQHSLNLKKMECRVRRDQNYIPGVDKLQILTASYRTQNEAILHTKLTKFYKCMTTPLRNKLLCQLFRALR